MRWLLPTLVLVGCGVDSVVEVPGFHMARTVVLPEAGATWSYATEDGDTLEAVLAPQTQDKDRHRRTITWTGGWDATVIWDTDVDLPHIAELDGHAYDPPLTFVPDGPTEVGDAWATANDDALYTGSLDVIVQCPDDRQPDCFQIRLEATEPWPLAGRYWLAPDVGIVAWEPEDGERWVLTESSLTD